MLCPECSSTSSNLSAPRPPSSCRHRRGDQRAGGDAGRHVQRLRLRPVPVPGAPPAGARALVLHPDVQVPAFLLLQELRLHPGSLLVLVLQRILGSGQRRNSNIGIMCLITILSVNILYDLKVRRLKIWLNLMYEIYQNKAILVFICFPEQEL